LGVKGAKRRLLKDSLYNKKRGLPGNEDKRVENEEVGGLQKKRR